MRATPRGGRRGFGSPGAARLRPALASFALLALVSASGTLAADTIEPPESAPGGSTKRPKIALVLSGGGARGASHIGILQVLEELRIPIDYVTGNSMGAIVGGYYAAGYSPDQLAHEITSIDWIDIFRDLPARRYLNFRRKQDDREYQVQLRLGFKDWRFQFPKGLVQGQKLDLTLKRLALPVWGVRDFDDLPLPYRAVATDIENGEAVILSRGELPRAIRASMSVPGAFAPVRIDGRMLVDGMVSNNIPIDAAKAFEPDVVIAIDIGTPPLDIDQITSAFAVSGQVLTLLMQEGTKKQLALLEPTDLLIEPDLEGISTADFPKVGKAIKRGREAAEARRSELARFSVSEEEWARYLARQRMRPWAPPVVDAVRIDNQSRLSPLVIRSRLGVEEGEPLDLDVVEDDIQEIFAMDVFESVDWDLIRTDEETVLEIKTREKSWGTNSVRFKLEIDENFQDTHIYNVGFRVTVMPVNRFNGEWRNDFQFGETLRLGSEFYQPVTPSSRWFVAPGVEYSTPEVNVFEDDEVLGRYNLRNTIARLDLGRELGSWGEIRGGLGYVNQRASPIVGREGLPIVNTSSGAYFARFSVDTVDQVAFPTRGFQGALQYTGVPEALGADEDLSQLLFSGSISHTWWKTTASLIGRVVTDFDAPVLGQANQLGGFLRLSGLNRGQIAGRKTLFGALVLYQQLARPSLLGFHMPLYLGGSVETGGAWADWDDLEGESLIWAGSVFFGANTVLGPIYLAYGGATDDNHAVYLAIGRSF